MRIAHRVEFKPLKYARASAMASATAIWIVVVVGAASVPVLAQNSAHTGASIPDQSVITTAPDPALTPATPRAKPSAAIAAPAQPTVYGPYVPYHGPQASGAGPAATNAASTSPFDPDANLVTEATAGSGAETDDRRLLTGPKKAANDPDAGIVTYVPSLPGEIPDGTLVKAHLREQLSTLTTRPGARFTAEISEPVMRDGRVVIPIGAILGGRVTWVRSGKRVGGSAAIHIEPYTVTLPDGSQYDLHARVIDTNSWDNTKVDGEGTIMRSENKKRNAAVMGLTTGSGLAAGAMIGGVPGALIGAGVGAGISTVVWLQQDRQAVLPKDLGLVFSLTAPMRVTPASAEAMSPTPATHGGS
ncbi:MAG: hypothetical protein ABR910_05985 [Acidobacteriaceae bacterium]|jgi:hypothetical protein